MENQLDIECTDMGTFLGRISHRLTKEGHSLQAMARMWYEKGEDKLTVIEALGIDVSVLGEELLLLRNQLCKDCMLKEVVVSMSVGSTNTHNDENEGNQN